MPKASAAVLGNEDGGFRLVNDVDISPDSKGALTIKGANGCAAEGEAHSLSCSHNSAQPELPFRLSGSQRKTAHALKMNAAAMIEEFGINRVLFVTFTIGERGEDGRWKKIVDMKEASALWNAINRRKIGSWFERMIVVPERHKDGGIHFHALAVARSRFGDVRTGLNFEQVAARNYASAPEGVRVLWSEMREALPEFGFGRSEALPIKKTGEAVACYVAKYVEKNLFNRSKADVGARLVRYVGWPRGEHRLKSNNFSWATPGAIEWRKLTRALFRKIEVKSPEDAREAFGSRWAFKVTGVMAEVLRMPPSMDAEVRWFAREFMRREIVDENWQCSLEDKRRYEEFGDAETFFGKEAEVMKLVASKN